MFLSGMFHESSESSFVSALERPKISLGEVFWSLLVAAKESQKDLRGKPVQFEITIGKAVG